MTHARPTRIRCAALLLSLLPLVAAPADAFGPKMVRKDLDSKEYFRSDLTPGVNTIPYSEIETLLPNRAAWASFFAKYGADSHVFIDLRTGTAAGIVTRVPIIPGTGDGNAVSLVDVGKAYGAPVAQVTPESVTVLVRKFFEDNREAIGIDPAEMGEFRTTQVSPDLWQVYVPQKVRGIPVRGGHLLATISHGNLVLAGANRWMNVGPQPLHPEIDVDTAVRLGFQWVGGAGASDEIWKKPELELIPYGPAEFQAGEGYAGPVGQGVRHRLAWVFGFRRIPELAAWEVVVDAATGEILAFEDKNHYISKGINGGIYPVTSTEVCPSPAYCGSMQLDYPMPWADTGFPAPNNYTNSAGRYDWTSGTATTALNGKYVRISDNCGAISNAGASGDIQLGGANAQHDCVTGGGSAGNTPASRSAFYEVNRIAELARGWLPMNTWLQNQLTSNVNINQTCNGFWNGSTINFYRSGGGCRNTGELAAVFDHEWGHGMDDNDANGVISNSGEAYADIVGVYRLQSSCVGYGFFQTINFNCGQTLDGTGYNYDEDQRTGAADLHCTTNCSGVRDADWGNHSDNFPDSPDNHVCVRCNTSSAVCGRQTHCAAAPIRQMAWDFVARDLRAAPFNYDSNRSFLVGNRTFYLGSGNVSDWHTCTCPSTSAGCGAANGYMQWIAADDDNGNINDGTPHMTAIYASYNRHKIACPPGTGPTVQNGGCAGAPTTAATLTVGTTADHQASLSWTAVSGATGGYWVFRGDGHAGCDFGKARVATLPAGTLSWVDNEVANGRAYSYYVVAAGTSSACFGPPSNCVTFTPQCKGLVTLDRATYSCADTITISLVDSDLVGAGTATVGVTSSVEATPETVNLLESPANSGRFSGTIATTGAAPGAGNGVLSVADGGAINVRYVDASWCQTANVNVDTPATGDCAGPVITNVMVSQITDSTARVTWTTNEASNSRVTHGTSAPPATNTDVAAMVTSHVVDLSGLSSCTDYLYQVRSADLSTNVTIADNGGSYYSFKSYGRSFLFGLDDVESPTTTWTPTGTASSIWHIDTCKAYSGTKAWKAGAAQGTCPGTYGTSATTDLTSQTIALPASAGHGYRFRFREWYATESNTNCTYDPLVPQISTNGGGAWTSLTTVYCGTSGGWTRRDIDLSAYTGNVLLRFHFVSDSAINLEGWYIDDIDISRPIACGPEVQESAHVVTDDCAAGGAGDGNGVVDPGETATLQMTAANSGVSTATGIAAVLSTSTPGVTVTDPNGTFPNIAAGASAPSNANHFAFAVSPSFTCGTNIAFQVNFTSNEGNWSDSFTVPTGTGGAPGTTDYDSTDVPKTIADNAIVTSTIAVASTLTVTDVNVRLSITHTYDGDLDIFLIGPNGTRVELSTDNGGSGDNFTNTVFDDEAATAITAGTAPFTGSFRPEGSLATLDGIPANGTWTLEVGDDASQDTGSLTAWRLTLTTVGAPTCNNCAAAAAPKPVRDGNLVAGQPMRATKNADSIDMTWDVSGCASNNYNIYSGSLSNFAAITGGSCSIGASGSISDEPMPANAWWVVAGTLGGEVSSFGHDSSGSHSSFTGWAGVCPAQTTQNTTGVCP